MIYIAKNIAVANIQFIKNLLKQKTLCKFKKEKICRVFFSFIAIIIKTNMV